MGERENWPSVTETSEADWQQAQRSFYQETDRLLGELKERPQGLLKEQVPGRDYDF